MMEHHTITAQRIIHIVVGVFVASLYFASFQFASALTISGTLYVDEGLTAHTGTSSIMLAVGTTTPATVYSTTTDTSGNFTFENITLNTSTPLVFWIDASSTLKATTFTKSSSSVNDISGISLFKDYAILRHEGTSGTSTTNIDLSVYDGDDDSDILYVVGSDGALLIQNDSTVYIPSGKIYEPSSTTTLMHVKNVGTILAPPVLTIGGNFAQNGTFTHNSGTVYSTGLGVRFTGTFTGSSAFHHFEATQGTSTEVFSFSILNEAESGNLVLDEVNRVMYRGSTGGGIYRCPMSTFCDASADWSIATDTPASAYGVGVIDYASSTLYFVFQSGGDGIVYRCALSTNCDSSSDYTIATNTEATSFSAIAIDPINNVLYVGGQGGSLYRCALATGCDGGTDFALATTTGDTSVYDIAFDLANEVMYFGSPGQSRIHRCVLSTGCDGGTDFTYVESFYGGTTALAIDDENDVLYMGTTNGGVVRRCVLSSGCDTSGEFPIVFDASVTSENVPSFSSSVQEIFVDSFNDILYVMTSDARYLYRCDLRTGCDAQGDFRVASSTLATMNTMTFDPLTTSLYALDNGGRIYRHTGGVTFGDAASTTNFTLAPGHAVIAPTSTLTVRGDFNRYGAFTHSTGTVMIASTSAQSIRGGVASTSPYYSLTLDGAGVKTFADSYVPSVLTDNVIYTSVIDTENNDIYFAGGNGGPVFKCSLSSRCDDASDYTTIDTSLYANVQSLAIDTTNDVLYGGTGNSGMIFKCTLSSGCDVPGDFTTATDTPQTIIYSLRIDNTNGVLYAGTDVSGIIYRCVLSTGCDSTGDYTTAYDSSETIIYELLIDEEHDILYAGTSGNGLVYACALSTDCDTSGDFTTVFDAPTAAIRSFVVDPEEDVLYVGTGVGDSVYRCPMSTGCDASGDFTLVFNPADTSVYSMAIDTDSRALFVTSGRTLYRCELYTKCDADADFLEVYIEPSWSSFNTLVVNPDTNQLYVGGARTVFEDSSVLVCDLRTKCANHTADIATTDFTISDGTVYLPDVVTVARDYSGGGVVSATNTTAFYLGDDYAQSGTLVTASTTYLYLHGTTQQDLSGTLTQLPSVVTSGAGTKVFGADTRVNGVFNIQSGSSVTAPSSLTIGGSFSNSGTFTHNNGTVNFTGLGASLSGTLAFNNVSVGVGTSTDAFVTAADTAATTILSITADTLNHIAYFGTHSGGIIYRCDMRTFCDNLVTDYTTATDTPVSRIYSMVFDAVNGAIYAGSDTGGFVYKCLTATGCDGTGEWTTATDTPAAAIPAMVVDAVNGVVYAGSDTGGIIYRCVLSTGCDGTGEWTTATDTPVTGIDSLEIDTGNGVLYVGTQSTGIIYRCVLSTGCDGTGDFTLAYDSTEFRVIALEVDTTNGVLYAGTNSGGLVYRCLLATGCDEGTDFTTVLTTRATNLNALVIDSVHGVLYVGADDGSIRSCPTITGCDAESDFAIVYSVPSQTINSLYHASATDGSLFVGTGSGGIILRRSGGVQVESSTMTVDDLSVASGKLFMASTTLTIGGDFTNNGHLRAGSSTVFSTTGTQGFRGNTTSFGSTLAGLNAFQNIRFTGGGTTAIAAFNGTSMASTTGNVVIDTGHTLDLNDEMFHVSVGGNFTNSGTFGAPATTTFATTSGNQMVSGTFVGTSAFQNVQFTGGGTTTLASNASSTGSFVIESGDIVVAPSVLGLLGNYTNNGTFKASSGTTTFSGTTQQILSGNLVGENAFHSLDIQNTSGSGGASQSIIFANSASTTGTFGMRASTSVQFLSNSTTTFQNLRLAGESGRMVWLRSSVPGTSWHLIVPGTQELVTYVNVQDSNACSGNPNIAADDGSSVDAGNNTCWTFAAGVLSFVSDADQTFYVGQSTTSISTITLSESAVPTITAANDIRISIATSSVGMLWDTSDTTAVFGGTASGKVSNPVSYEGGGSVLVIPVDTNFSASDTLTINGLSFAQFTNANIAVNALRAYTEGSSDTTIDATDTRTVTIGGALTLAPHTSGQVTDNFNGGNELDVPLYVFSLVPDGESALVTEMVFDLTGIKSMTAMSFGSTTLYRDMDNNQVYSVGDVAVGGEGFTSVTNQTGTITFSESFDATTTRDYILVADITDISFGTFVTITLDPSRITASGSTTLLTLISAGTAGTVQHERGSYGGGSSSPVGGSSPASDVVTGGSEGGYTPPDPNNGTSLSSEVGYNPPTTTGAPENGWTNGANAYTSDGVYATANSASSQSYGTFGFSVNGNELITGIMVKVEASASTNAGTFSVRLSWDNGTSWTSPISSPTLTTSDAVYTFGGASALWGHVWTPSEVGNGQLLVELIAAPSSNTISVDAFHIYVGHQVTGGGGGGGGRSEGETTRFFASVYVAVGRSVWEVIMSLFGIFR